MPNPPIWPVQPLHDAADVPLSKNPGTLPNMSDVIGNWFQLLTFDKVIKTIVNFNVVETTTPLMFQGVFQPFTKQKLMMKPEGQRLWKWFMVHAWPTLILNPDDVIIDQSGTQYRVMEKNDLKEYGFVEYDLVQDYTGSGPASV